MYAEAHATRVILVSDLGDPTRQACYPNPHRAFQKAAGAPSKLLPADPHGVSLGWKWRTVATVPVLLQPPAGTCTRAGPSRRPWSADPARPASTGLFRRTTPNRPDGRARPSRAASRSRARRPCQGQVSAAARFQSCFSAPTAHGAEPRSSSFSREKTAWSARGRGGS